MRRACSPAPTSPHCARCWTATRSRTASSRPGCEAAGLDPWRLGARDVGLRRRGELDGGSATPAPTWSRSGTRRPALAAFADRARRQGRRCSSIVGPAHAVAALWDRLEPYWGPARDVRACQPLFATPTGSRTWNPRPRWCTAWCPRTWHNRASRRPWRCSPRRSATSPMAVDGGTVLPPPRRPSCCGQRRMFVRRDRRGRRDVQGRSLARSAPGSPQVHGVWVDPRWRGQGIAAPPAMAAVVRLRRCARTRRPSPSTSTTSTCRPARAYERVGLRNVGTFCSVLF